MHPFIYPFAHPWICLIFYASRSKLQISVHFRSLPLLTQNVRTSMWKLGRSSICISLQSIINNIYTRILICFLSKAWLNWASSPISLVSHKILLSGHVTREQSIFNMASLSIVEISWENDLICHYYLWEVNIKIVG